MLFLRSLKVFISSREINLCSLDTYPIIIASKSSMYNRVPGFRTTLDFTLQLQLYTSLKQTRFVFNDSEKQQTPATEMVNFISKSGVLFQGCTTEWFYEFPHFTWYTPPHIIGASDFAVRKVSFNRNKGRLSVMNLRSPGLAAVQTITVKVKCKIPFSGPIQGSVRGSRVLFLKNSGHKNSISVYPFA